MIVDLGGAAVGVLAAASVVLADVRDRDAAAPVVEDHRTK